MKVLSDDLMTRMEYHKYILSECERQWKNVKKKNMDLGTVSPMMKKPIIIIRFIANMQTYLARNRENNTIKQCNRNYIEMALLKRSR